MDAQIEFDENERAFKFNYFTANANDLINRVYKGFFEQYQKMQSIIQLKFPINQYFRVAKIRQIISQPNSFYVQFYYDGSENQEFDIKYLNSEFTSACPLTKTYDNDLKTLDVIGIKNVFQSLIETFHWSANFGYFFDPILQNLLRKKDEPDLFVFLPNFSIISKYLMDPTPEFSPNKFDDFRRRPYQNASYTMFFQFATQFIKVIKQQDDDFHIYNQIIEKNKNQQLDLKTALQLNESLYGVDRLYSEDLVKRKMLRFGLKQSLILYQLSSNQVLLQQLQHYSQLEKEIVEKKNDNANFASQSPQSNNFSNYLDTFKKITGTSLDLLTPFAVRSLDALNKKYSEGNAIQYAFRPNWKNVSNKHDLEKVLIQKADQQSLQLELKWISNITAVNQIYTQVSQSGALIDKDVKKLTIIYKVELIEQKLCYIFKTQVPEIVFSIDTADDIMYLVNIIQKEKLATNVYIDDTRKLTLYTSIIQGKPEEFLTSALKIMDLHQIYFYVLLDFYYKNIQTSKQIKESRYASFIRELVLYVQDFERDFEEQMNAIFNNKLEIGF